MSYHPPPNRLWRRTTAVAAAFALAVTSLTATTAGPATAGPATGEPTVDPLVYEQLATERATKFFVHLTDTADLTSVEAFADRAERAAHVYHQLTSVADTSQADLRADLTARGVDHTPFWITNTLLVQGDRRLVDELATRPDVSHIEAHTDLQLLAASPASGPEWGITDIGAHHAWNLFGVRGQGAVVASIGTGTQYDHPALVQQYRGNLGGGNFNHNYSWFDFTGQCSPGVPCDNNNHGTHVTGTMVGDDGAGNQIGVAPGAKWITAKACGGTGACSQSHLLAAGQWMLAPTDLNGQNPAPSRAPHAVVNPWGGPGGNTWYQPVLQAWIAAGILPVFAASGSGSGCGTISSPADNPEAYAVGAYNSSHQLSFGSGRGPGINGSIKPDITAPGVSIRSSVTGGGYATFSGTSMAAAHTTGAAALVWSAKPTLTVAQVRQVLDATAVSVSDLSCGGSSNNNNVWGEGRLNAFHAVWLASTM